MGLLFRFKLKIKSKLADYFAIPGRPRLVSFQWKILTNLDSYLRILISYEES